MALILDPSSAAGGRPGDAGGDLIKETNTDQFPVDVIEASMKVPVIVDFWAPWCGPCKQLTPVLEKLVRQAAGLVRLVKINVDENQALAGQLRIQSIPTVYAFIGGQPVDGFVGGQPESKLRAFIDRLTQGAESPIDDALSRAQEALDMGAAKEAAAIYSQILQEDPTNPKAVAGLLRSRVTAGDSAAARHMLDGLSPELARQSEIEAAKAAIELAEQKGKAGDFDALSRRVDANPDDHQARLDLALALYAAGRVEASIDALLEGIRRDRSWNDEAARKQLVKIFDALGPSNPLTVTSRKRLSSILFS